MEFNETLWLVVLYTGAYTFICSEVTVRKVVVIVCIKRNRLHFCHVAVLTCFKVRVQSTFLVLHSITLSKSMVG